jgi:hypothetical protein
LVNSITYSVSIAVSFDNAAAALAWKGLCRVVGTAVGDIGRPVAVVVALVRRTCAARVARTLVVTIEQSITIAITITSIATGSNSWVPWRQVVAVHDAVVVAIVIGFTAAADVLVRFACIQWADVDTIQSIVAVGIVIRDATPAFSTLRFRLIIGAAVGTVGGAVGISVPVGDTASADARVGLFPVSCAFIQTICRAIAVIVGVYVPAATLTRLHLVGVVGTKVATVRYVPSI